MGCLLRSQGNGQSTLTGILSGGGPLLEGNQFIQEIDFFGKHLLKFELDADTNKVLKQICDELIVEVKKWRLRGYNPTLTYTSIESRQEPHLLTICCSDELVVRAFCDAIQASRFNFSMLVFGRAADETLSACEA